MDGPVSLSLSLLGLPVHLSCKRDEAPEKCAKDFPVHLDYRVAGEAGMGDQKKGKRKAWSAVEYLICTYHIQGLLHETAMDPQLLLSLG